MVKEVFCEVDTIVDMENGWQDITLTELKFEQIHPFISHDYRQDHLAFAQFGVRAFIFSQIFVLETLCLKKYIMILISPTSSLHTQSLHNT